jgi:hypothetical protein
VKFLLNVPTYDDISLFRVRGKLRRVFRGAMGGFVNGVNGLSSVSSTSIIESVVG